MRLCMRQLLATAGGRARARQEELQPTPRPIATHGNCKTDGKGENTPTEQRGQGHWCLSRASTELGDLIDLGLEALILLAIGISVLVGLEHLSARRITIGHTHVVETRGLASMVGTLNVPVSSSALLVPQNFENWAEPTRGGVGVVDGVKRLGVVDGLKSLYI